MVTARQRVKTGVLVSGSGTNLQALMDAASDPDFPAEIKLVVSNKPGVKSLERAAGAGVEAKVIDHTEFDDRSAFERSLDTEFRAAGCEIVCLAGFMRILTDDFVGEWSGRLLNIHPSLLPAFPGLNTHSRALKAGVRVAGCTVHLVSAKLDAGPILIQAVVPVHQDDTPDSLAARVLVQEHLIYPKALAWLATKRVSVEHGRAMIQGSDHQLYVMMSPGNS